MFEAKWTGEYPSHCIGTWILYKNGKDISDMIPDNLRTSHMNTKGIYVETGLAGPEYEEYYNEYTDGLDCDEWIQENQYWINNICDSHDECVELYDEFNSEDWRPGQCGGCK